MPVELPPVACRAWCCPMRCCRAWWPTRCCRARGGPCGAARRGAACARRCPCGAAGAVALVLVDPGADPAVPPAGTWTTGIADGPEPAPRRRRSLRGPAPAVACRRRPTRLAPGAPDCGVPGPWPPCWPVPARGVTFAVGAVLAGPCTKGNRPPSPTSPPAKPKPIAATYPPQVTAAPANTSCTRSAPATDVSTKTGAGSPARVGSAAGARSSKRTFPRAVRLTPPPGSGPARHSW